MNENLHYTGDMKIPLENQHTHPGYINAFYPPNDIGTSTSIPLSMIGLPISVSRYLVRGASSSE